LSPVISKVVPMEEAAALHELIEEGKSVGRVVVDPNL
jgi:NADPH:quinone reductase-like Zn-dependent oxidoreductase